MQVYNLLHPKATAATRTLSFVKEDGIWFADLPEFLELGLGTKANLMMVDGADTFLDLLTKHNRITLQVSTQNFKGSTATIKKINRGMNVALLRELGHAPVDYGAYYEAVELHGKPFQHQLWLCPVTEYVFGAYPEEIFIQSLKN